MIDALSVGQMKISFDWIMRAISGSTNAFHIQCCHTLKTLFYQRYGPPNGGNEQFDKDFTELTQALTAKEKVSISEGL